MAIDYKDRAAAEIVCLLLECGANPNSTKEENSALYRAVEAENVEAVKALRLKGANVSHAGCDARRAIKPETESTAQLEELLTEAGLAKLKASMHHK